MAGAGAATWDHYWNPWPMRMVEARRTQDSDDQAASAPALGGTSGPALHGRALGYAIVVWGFLSHAAEQTNLK